MLLRPRPGFRMAWAGEVATTEPGRRTDREFAPVLDALEALESAPASTRLPARSEWAPVTPDLLSRVHDGLQGR